MNIPDMTGKTVVLTGGNSGIGLEAAVALAGAGAKMVITVRDEAKGRDAIAAIEERTGKSGVEMVVFDLSNLASVRQGAAEILERFPRIDVLINNAGLVLTNRQETADGLEATFAINHLGPFLLTQLLLDRLVASAPARIVNVSSDAHKGAPGGLDFDDLQSTKRYIGMQVYGRTKLANIYFTTELARRLEGTGVTVNALHPGTVATGFGRDGDAKGIIGFGIKLITPFILTAEKGARTTVYLASSPDLEGVTGQYFYRSKPHAPTKAAQDSAAAKRLWDVSEELVAKSGAPA